MNTTEFELLATILSMEAESEVKRAWAPIAETTANEERGGDKAWCPVLDIHRMDVAGKTQFWMLGWWRISRTKNSPANKI
jgi:hypothetical protein